MHARHESKNHRSQVSIEELVDLLPEATDPNRRADWGCTKFCGTGFKPMKKHGQDGRATLLDAKIRTAPQIQTDPLAGIH